MFKCSSSEKEKNFFTSFRKMILPTKISTIVTTIFFENKSHFKKTQISKSEEKKYPEFPQDQRIFFTT